MSDFEQHEHMNAWKRYEDASHKEKDWMHQRLGWLFATQGFLFAGFVAVLRFISETKESDTENQDLINLEFVIPIFGIIVSLAGFIGTFAAARMHWIWTSQLNKIVNQTLHPRSLTFGTPPYYPARTSSIIPPLLSLSFILVWVILATNILSKGFSVYSLISSLIALLFILVPILILEVFERRKFNDRFSDWTPNIKYGWNSDAPHVESKLPHISKFNEDTIHVFDFDGVICSDKEEKIYRLEKTDKEEEILNRLAAKLKIRCEGMNHNYQRHLLFQAVAFNESIEIQRGPAFELVKELSDKNTIIFVLSARSGWFAVERQRRFLSQHAITPVEAFQVGRATKDRQIQKLLDEYPGKHINYYEDRRNHIDDVYNLVSSKDRNRLHCFHVQPNQTFDLANLRAEFDELIRKYI